MRTFRGLTPGIPDEHLLIVTDRAEQVLMFRVPSHIFDNTRVALVDVLRKERPCTLGHSVYVPQANLAIVRAADHVATT